MTGLHVRNDWKEAPDGSAYRRALEARRRDLDGFGEFADGLCDEAHSRFVEAAPAERAGGEPVAEAPVRGVDLEKSPWGTDGPTQPLGEPPRTETSSRTGGGDQMARPTLKPLPPDHPLFKQGYSVYTPISTRAKRTSEKKEEPEPAETDDQATERRPDSEGEE